MPAAAKTTAPKTDQPAAAKSTAKRAAPAGAFVPTLVHAYRRSAHMVPAPNGLGYIEVPVTVVFEGEKVEFKTNEQGHVVGMVNNERTYGRLIKEIPEAYIKYAGGDNVPTARILAAEHSNELRPEGELVLESLDGEGKKQYKVLDELDDEELREFAAEVGLTDEQLPGVLVGESLARAIFNLLKT